MAPALSRSSSLLDTAYGPIFEVDRHDQSALMASRWQFKARCSSSRQTGFFSKQAGACPPSRRRQARSKARRGGVRDHHSLEPGSASRASTITESG